MLATAIINAHSGGSTITMTNAGSGIFDLRGGASADIITGGSGNDIIDGKGADDVLDGGAGDDNVTGGTGDDTFKVTSGTDTVTDLGGAGSDDDVLIVSSGASVNATNIIGFTAKSTTQNNSTNANNAVLNAKDGGRTIDVSLATGSSKAFKIVGGDG